MSAISRNPSSSTPLPAASSPHIAPMLPWYTRLRYNILMYGAQALLKGSFYIIHILGLRSPLNKPNYTKAYPSYPTLVHRFFIPKQPKAANSVSDGVSDETPKYPLYIDIHGGGFALLSPVVNDSFNRPFCDKHSVVVISLDYPKAPAHKFPSAVNALSDIVVTILNDDSLPIDRSRVLIGGDSAGGNLSFGIAQDERLQGKIHGVKAYYPPVDFTHDRAAGAEYFKEKGWKVAGKALPVNWMDMFNSGYIEGGQDLRDPRLSPRFAERGKLPSKILTVGCQWDFLCKESELMMKEWAGGGVDGDEWEKDGLKWICVEGEDHAFDHGQGYTDPKLREERAEKTRERVDEWLFREVFA